MLRALSHRWADVSLSHWRLILIGWIVIAIAIRIAAPSWNEVAYDGDFEYLPAEMASVAGGRLLDRAFPGKRSRSQIILVMGRHAGPLKKSDLTVGFDLLRRLYHRLAEVSWQRAIEFGYQGGPIDESSPAAPWLRLTEAALNHSIESDERFYQAIQAEVPELAPTLREPRMAIAYWDRATFLETVGGAEAQVAADFEAALILKPDLPQGVLPIEQRELTGWSSLLDVMSWDDSVIGSTLRSDGANLTVMQLSSELAAVSNIATVEATAQLLEDVRKYSLRYTEPGLRLLMTGSAAIGGETLLASRDAIRYTETLTVLMILVILAFVYRAPLLVLIPVISIGIAVVVSSGLVALLTKWSIDGTVPGLDLRVFTTSRIFVVVILFGAGTDYCLFLIARLREEAWQAEWDQACRRALSGVSGALLGSALTTIVGLGMLWIADFGKFHYTGPVIAVCLAVGLVVCTTFTPALLRAAGPRVFWPGTIPSPSRKPVALLSGRTQTPSISGGIWGWIAVILTRYPIVTLVGGIALLAIPSVYGYRHEGHVTYDLSSQLSPSSNSRQGLELLSSHFPIGEVNPVTVLLLRPEAAPQVELERDIAALGKRLYELPGVVAVRTADDPLGDFPPDRDMGLFNTDAWRRRALKNHRIAQRYFFASDPDYQSRLTRVDVVMDGDPFSNETASLVRGLGNWLIQESADENSEWYRTRVLLAGTTPSIIDLRTVTMRDNRRIKVAVIVAVFAVLVLVIGRVGLCLYLIVTVLLSYYATLGLTVLTFRQLYGADFVGLDWKLPLFLFVILVAVGQDYNVYLVTRIVEEERHLGWLSALRRAVSRTGGIITACGLVMAATFFSMTASAWAPTLLEFVRFGSTESSVSELTTTTTLRGIVELGFALGLGVLIDTFYVRTILVSSFVVVLGRWSPQHRNRVSHQRRGHRHKP